MQSSDPENSEYKGEVEAQYNRVDALYKRQLSVPLIGHEETFEEYQSFCDSSIVTKESLPNYMRALKRLEVLRPFEEQLQDSEQSSFEKVYDEYVSKLIEVKEESTLINTVFQRAIASSPDTALNTDKWDIWDRYLTFLATEFSNIKSVLLSGQHFAVRNLPWVVKYWIMYTQTLERMNEPHEKIVTTYESAVGDNFQEGNSYLQVWTAYCDYLHRRQTKVSGEDERDAVRSVFVRAREYLNVKKFNKPSDPDDTLSRYQASLEARCYDNMSQARTLWSNVMKRHGNQAQYWLEYIELERGYGDLNNCRKLFLMSVNSVNDDPDRVCTAFLQFEREQGTLESFLTAEKKCTAQLERIKERREKAAAEGGKKGNDSKRQRKGATKTEQQYMKQKESPGQSGNRKKRKMDESSHVFYTDDEQKSKVMKMDDTTNYSSSNNGGIEELKVSQAKSDEAIIKPPEKKLSQSSSGVEEHTVFVSNLSFNTTKEQLEEVFSQCGQVADVRLIRKTRGGGRPNIYAYVEYTSADPLSQALLMDRSQLNNRPIYVSTCKSSSNTTTTEKQNKYNDKATVFVTNIAHDLTEKQLEEVFQEAGEIKGVRLVRNRQGRSKGFAYIEYTSEASAKRAVLSLDGREMSGKGIKVAMSNPPASKGGPSSSSQLGVPFSMETDLPNIRKPLSLGPKTNISLVPRALARKKPFSVGEKDRKVSEESDSTGGVQPPIEKKSNEDFRKLLLKK